MTTATPVPVAIALPLPAGFPPTRSTSVWAHWRSALKRFVLGCKDHPARWLVAGIAAITLISGCATLASPYLVGRAPLLLMCMSPRMAFLGIAASDTPLITFVVLGTARLGLTDPLHFLIGRRLDATLHHPYESVRPRRRARMLLRRIAAAVPPPIRLTARPACYLAVLLRPNGLNLLWAGTQRLPAARVAMLDLIGTLVYLIAVHTGAAALTG